MLPKVFLKQESLGLSMEQGHLGARQIMAILYINKENLTALLNSDTDIEGIYTCLAKNGGNDSYCMNHLYELMH